MGPHVELLPNSGDIEKTILGAILLDESGLQVLADLIEKSDFYFECGRVVYARMLAMAAESVPIDLHTLTEELRKHDELEQVGGIEYLCSLTDGLPRATNIEAYSSMLLEHSARRKLLQVSKETSQRSLDHSYPVSEIIEQTQREMLEIGSRSANTDFQPAVDLIPGVYSEIEKRSENRSTTLSGLDTGFSDLNALTCGLHPQNLIVVAARPGIGKTSFCLNVGAYAAIELKKRVGIFSLEMSKGEVIRRILSAEAGVGAHRMQSGFLNQQNWVDLKGAAGRLASAQLFINDQGVISIGQMRAKAQRLASKIGLDLLIVDYLQLASGGGRRLENRVQEVGELSRGLKLLAKDLNIPILVASQLNRSIEYRNGDRKPRLSDLRESGSIEQDADVVLFIWRQEVYEPTEENIGLAELIIGKNRNGPPGSIKLGFVKEFTRFVPMLRE